MRYLFWGVLSLFLMASCTPRSFDVCSAVQHTTEFNIFKTRKSLTADSRGAVVKVYSVTELGRGVGTGTVFEFKGQTIVLTAAHVLGPAPYYFVIDTGFEEVQGELIYLDEQTDLAVILLPECKTVSPMRFNPVRPKSVKFGDKTLYSGYPNNDSLLTLEGYIAGDHPWGYLLIHSYTWPGSSGSAVFDSHGRVIGVLIAVSVGEDITGMPTLIEDIMVVTPIWRLDLEALESILESS
jgi:S1-C subfamily serine protease